MREILFLSLAGALGALCRYGLSGAVQKMAGIGFPVGTLIVNVVGSALIGYIMQIGLNTDIIPRSLRVIMTIGFLGAFTTFSTFSYETVKFMEEGAWLSGILNIIVNVGLCLMATILGMLIGRITTGGAG